VEWEWEVWLADGRRLTSADIEWADLPDGILVVRYWGARNGVNWDDGLYGHPATLKAAGMTDDETFAAVLYEAKRSHVPPSQRP
jgi:hypothetical protein